MDPRPPGGFLSYFHHPQFSPFPSSPHPPKFPPPIQGQTSLKNYHFVGVPRHFGTFSPPPPPNTKGTSSTSMSFSRKVSRSLGKVGSKKKKQVINVDDDEEPDRIAQRLPWTREEDKKLASAWLENSNDPIDGNNKKNEKYWEDIVVVYNSTMPKERRRGANQLKLRFHHVKALINAFHGQWCSVNKIYRSGYSDDQLTNMTLKKYENLYSKPFVYVHMWRVLKDKGKWLAYIKMLNDDEMKSPSGGIDLTSHIVDVDKDKRSVGYSSAKGKRSGKRMAREMPGALAVLSEKLDKLI